MNRRKFILSIPLLAGAPLALGRQERRLPATLKRGERITVAIPRIKFSIDTKELTEALNELQTLTESLELNVLERLIKLIYFSGGTNNLGVVEAGSVSARTGEGRIFAKPTDFLRGLLAAFRVGEINSFIVDREHSNSSAELVVVT